MTSDGPNTGVDLCESAQLRAIGRLHAAFEEQGVDYWLFGGWAVDFHLGRVTREHADVDIAVWLADLDRVGRLLEAAGWEHVPEPEENGYTAYQQPGLRLEVAFLARDEAGAIYTPLVDGRGEWPPGTFPGTQAAVDGVRGNVVDLAALIADKSGPRDDPAALAKDRADVALLTVLRAAG